MEKQSKIRVYSVIKIICAALTAGLLIGCNSFIVNQPELDDIADTETTSKTSSEVFIDSSDISVPDEDFESPIDDTRDSAKQQDIIKVENIEQVLQEVQCEEDYTEAETSLFVQDTVPSLFEWEAETSITIRHVSELGLTFNPSIPNLAPDNEVRYIMLHHTYGLFETDGSIVGMHNDHRARTATLDGGGIAYSEIIQQDGTVWIARGELRPSHTGVSHDIRTHSYSITVSGNFDVVDRIMSDAQFYSLASRIAAAMRQFPNATIVGHSDLAPTACPGRSFPWDRLEESIGAVRGAPRG